MIKPWPARFAAFSLWALAALSASYWFTKVSGTSGVSTVAPALASEPPVVQSDALARVFGPATAVAVGTLAVAAPDPSARLRLLGVVANRSRSGVALISVDGQPAKPYRVGSALDGGWTLQQVGTRTATLSPAASNAAAVTLELASLSGALAPVARNLPNPLPAFAPGAVAPIPGVAAAVQLPANSGNEAPAKD
jgi:general secretion pathway protein C